MTNILLCGGSGTRLWPLSRELMPKQFLRLFDENSLFELCLQRNASFCSQSLIVSNEQQYFLALDQCENLQNQGKILQDSFSFLLEPLAKNTAAAITLATLALDKDELCLVSPSDHLIKDLKAYEKVLTRACELAQHNFLVTFGIKPNYAETGYGYIEAKGEEVLAFHEKPDLNTAQAYLTKGNFFWNSGMFVFKAGFFLEQMSEFAPDILKACKKAYENAYEEKALLRIKREYMLNIPELSIDYALMEKSNKVKMVQSDIQWSDVGSFDALYDEFDKDEHNNAIKAQTLMLESKNNLIFCSNSKKLIATTNLENLIIIDTEDALMICPKSKSQNVKNLVSKLKDQGEICKIHLTAHRPWGTYTVLEDEKGYKLKRIEVKPGKRLSLQKHFHRNEHWIVVSGTASVEIEGTLSLVRPNESIYIKMGQKHRLSNEGKIPVILIEAQVGEYTGEDDIVRIDDDFKRQ
ncbi:mannose-1-phosphate guanylyltransferase/mannose-6-phosphate isomerase [Campylobacter sp. MIT 12-5580]|uniref:mannose-1-phosphate guanylyltransferase/mannose-6-phosphate isomerase n=1 Tax=Campylobacter sp. MIT 12-5580 TaxID=2040651 RepID=UPI0010FA41F3|nr:mannose-1-phosphate guanylyltransferase/mannose-6-phosphate isomerase [Campylobacter sp. MIT 12-5580]TKX30164.1 mannose-1-phosphate guanylyltransferase/mannose-6-phosphate isomerase [Campylobacter sp. MIT 12-5580]